MFVIRATWAYVDELMTDRTFTAVSLVTRNLFPLWFWIRQRTWAVSLSLHGMYPVLSCGVTARTQYFKSYNHSFSPVFGCSIRLSLSGEIALAIFTGTKMTLRDISRVTYSHRMLSLAESVAWWRQLPISLVNPADRRLFPSEHEMGGYTTSADSHMY